MLQVTAITPEGRLKEAKDNFEYHFFDMNPSKSNPHKRRVGKCNGGYECTNPDCHDICGDGGKNVTAFYITRDRKGRHSDVTCRICAESQFIIEHPCLAKKVITLPENSVHAYVVMQGSHNATCSGFRNKKDTSGVIWKLHELINPGTKQVFVFSIYHENMYFSKAMYIYNTLGAVMILCYLDESDNKRFPHHVMWKLVNCIYTCLLPITLYHVSTSHDVQLLLSDFLMTHSYTIVSHHVM